MGGSSSREVFLTRAELHPIFDAFVSTCCTVEPGRYVSLHLLEAAFSRHLRDHHAMGDYLMVAAAAMEWLCTERAWGMTGWIGRPIRRSSVYDVVVRYDVDTRVVVGLSLDRFPTTVVGVEGVVEGVVGVVEGVEGVVGVEGIAGTVGAVGAVGTGVGTGVGVGLGTGVGAVGAAETADTSETAETAKA
jgi:hypothetical protein